MFEPLIIPFAFVLGFTLARASTCTVAATKRWVYKGKTDWFVGIMVAVSWSGVTLLVLKMLSLRAPRFLTAFARALRLQPYEAHVISADAALVEPKICGAPLSKCCFLGVESG